MAVERDQPQVKLCRGTEPMSDADLWKLSESIDEQFGPTLFGAGLRRVLLENQRLQRDLAAIAADRIQGGVKCPS